MEKAPDVAEAVEAFHRVIRDRDTESLESLMSGEVLVIGTDPDEWFEGQDALRVLREQLSSSSDMTIEAGDTSAYKVGDVGWFASRAAFVAGDRRIPVRHTGVLTRDGDSWKVVQSHVSIGVADDEAFSA